MARNNTNNTTRGRSRGRGKRQASSSVNYNSNVIIGIFVIVVICMIMFCKDSYNTNTNTYSGFANTLKKMRVRNTNNGRRDNKKKGKKVRFNDEDEPSCQQHNHQHHHQYQQTGGSNHTHSGPERWHQYHDIRAKERILNPLIPPERSFENTYGIPVNIETRGHSGGFQQVGALYKETVDSEDMKPGNNTDSVQLALYGKPTYPNSRKWTYYTTSDGHTAVKMPMSHKGNKCDSRTGCDEIMNDDLVSVPGYNGTFRVVIYDYDAPKYIPYV
jgi:hypothetical protein